MASSQIDYLEFHQKIESAIRSSEVSGTLGRAEIKRNLQKALALLPYFQVTREIVGTSTYPMVEVKGGFSVTRRHAEMVQLDLLRVTQDHVLEGPSHHMLITTDEGFKMAFQYVSTRNELCTFLLDVTALR
ncbi:MAG: hypothetical protein MUC92_09735 [Fimbriimonadaceae bacterium]|jgi:hypothetical protein|nr:hypothetical protein [Fimbriimonadaceae bacterium]